MVTQTHAVPRTEPLERIAFSPDMPVIERAGYTGSCRFRDDIWDLSPMLLEEPTEPLKINFSIAPPAFKDALKRWVFCMINRRMPVELIQRKHRAHSRHAPGGIVTAYYKGLLPLARSLDDKGIGRVCDVSAKGWLAYGDEVAAQPVERPTQTSRLFCVTQIWLFGPCLPPEDQIDEPTWEAPNGYTKLLGFGERTEANKVPPIPDETLFPFLIACATFVNDLSEDILRATRAYEAMKAQLRKPPRGGDKVKVMQYLDGLRRDGQPLPGRIEKGQLVPATMYLAIKLDVSYVVLRKAVQRAGIPIQRGAPLDIDIRGRIDGKPWTESVDFYDVSDLRRCLTAACAAVIAFTSGMRSKELRELTRGSSRMIEASTESPERFEIRARTFKGVVDSEGNAIAEGKIRDEPWSVIKVGHDAALVMESLHTHDTLFCAAAFDWTGRTKARSNLPAIGETVAYAMDRLIDWWNAFVEGIGHGNERIRREKDRNVTLWRFRPSIARFIARSDEGLLSEDGLLALSIQLGHEDIATTLGYASTSWPEFSEELEVQKALALDESYDARQDRLDAGEAVRGPARFRYGDDVGTYTRTYQGEYLTLRLLRKLLDDTRLNIHDSPTQLLACVYDYTKALCQIGNEQSPDSERKPNMRRCDPRCANAAFTDAHVAKMKKAIPVLEAAMPFVPQPLRDRYAETVKHYKAVIADQDVVRAPGVPSREVL